MNILFTKTAWRQYTEWQADDPKIVERINALLKVIQRTPFKGTGKPEPLRQNLKGFWSRRIDSEHRLIYRVVGKPEEGQRVEVIACKFHYTKL